MDNIKLTLCALLGVFICVLSAQTTVVLQQGNGYEGCEDAALFSDTHGNNKYSSRFKDNMAYVGKYKC